MSDEFEKLFSGTMGFFWPLDEEGKELEADSQRGYLQLGSDGLLALETLDENVFESFGKFDLDEPFEPKAIYGATTDASVLILQVVDGGMTTVLGGGKASARRYKAYAAVKSVDIEKLSSTSAREVEVFFPGIERWSEVEISEESSETFDDGRLRGFTVKLQNAPEESVQLDDDREIALSAYWSVRGPKAKRTLFAPVSVICRSASPVPIWQLVEPVLRVQELISLAYDGFVVAEGGVADLDMTERPPARSPLWNYFLMTVPQRVKVPKSLGEVPLFWLRQIGGVSGLGKWVRLSHEHPRLVKPLVNHLRRGSSSSELRLMEIATAMEYWCSVNKRKPGFEWTETSKTRKPSHALVDHLGDHATTWMGYPKEWADLFWLRYNQIKHEPSFGVDENEISLLGRVGARLLSAAVLGHVADDLTVAGRYLADHRLNGLGVTAKRVYGNAAKA